MLQVAPGWRLATCWMASARASTRLRAGSAARASSRGPSWLTNQGVPWRQPVPVPSGALSPSSTTARPGARTPAQSLFAASGLPADTVDTALLHIPLPDTDRLVQHVLFTEPRCVAMAASHRFAGQDVVRLEQLLQEPFVAGPREAGIWRDYWLCWRSAAVSQPESAPRSPPRRSG